MTDHPEQRYFWSVGDLNAEVIFKSIKNLHIAVYPPIGRVRVAAPHSMGQDIVRLAIMQKTGWIKTQQNKFLAVERQSPRKYVGGESHYLFGKRYRLKISDATRNSMTISRSYIHLHLTTQTQASDGARARVFRQEADRLLLAKIREIAKEENLNITETISFRKMTPKWFSFSSDKKKLWINHEMVTQKEDFIAELLRDAIAKQNKQNYNYSPTH